MKPFFLRSIAFSRVNSCAGKILAGQWWRPLTALTLHADWPHLLGNMAIGGVFVGRLSRDVGSGLAWGVAFLLQRHGRPGRRLNVLLALGSIGVVGIAWWAALVFG